MVRLEGSGSGFLGLGRELGRLWELGRFVGVGPRDCGPWRVGF